MWSYCVLKEKPFLVTTKRFDLQTSCMQKQCNFLIYLYQEYGGEDYEVFSHATESELLPSCGHLSFCLIHNKLDFLSIWKFTRSFNVSSLCLLARTSVNFFSFRVGHVIMKIYSVAAPKSVSTGINLNSGSAQVQILLAGCRRFAMVRISDNGPGWK